MTVNKVVKKALGVKKIVINSLELTETVKGEAKLIVRGRPHKNKQCRCPYCSDGKRLPIYDSSHELSHWRAMDFGGLLVEIESKSPRVTCPVHGVVTAAVPWAFPSSRFTKDFDLTVTWMAKFLNKSAVSSYMRIS